MLAVSLLAQDGEWAAGLRLELPGERVGCGPLTGHVTGRGLRDGADAGQWVRPSAAVGARWAIGLRTRARSQGWPLAPPRSRTGTTVSPTSPGEILARSALAVRPRDDSRGTAEDRALDQPWRPTR